MLVAPFVQLNTGDCHPAQRPPPLLVEAHQAIRFGCSPAAVRATSCLQLTGDSLASCLGDSPVSWGELNQLTCCFVLVRPLMCPLGELGAPHSETLRSP
jgi:hypothetical protein